jgi:hypothetical protein
MKVKQSFYFSISFLIILLYSCSLTEIDSEKARAVTEGYLNAVISGDLKGALNFYSSEYDEDATPEKRMEKLQRLQEVMGPVLSFQLTDSGKINAGDLPAMSFTYSVKHPKINSTEKFIVVREGSDYKISAHDIKSENNKSLNH